MEAAWIGLVGVIVGGFIAIVKDVWLEKKKRKQASIFLSIQVIFLLERFVDDCANVMSDNGMPDSDGYYRAIVSAPELELKSIKADWTSLQPKLAYEILNIQNLITSAEHYISGVAEHEAWPPYFTEIFDERQFQYSILGIEASRLAIKLREFNKFPKRSVDNWDPVESLKYRKEQIEKARAARTKLQP